MCVLFPKLKHLNFLVLTVASICLLQLVPIGVPLVAHASAKNCGGVTIKNYCIRPSAHLAHANLTNTNLTGAYMPGANLTNANLTGVDLTSANLNAATLNGATCPNGKVHGRPGASC